jgi:hypothetical protein
LVPTGRLPQVVYAEAKDVRPLGVCTFARITVFPIFTDRNPLTALTNEVPTKPAVSVRLTPAATTE